MNFYNKLIATTALIAATGISNAYAAYSVLTEAETINGTYSDHVESSGAQWAGGVFRLTGNTTDAAATPIVFNVNAQFHDNKHTNTGAGGAIYVHGRTVLNVNGSTFDGNHADWEGGAISSETPKGDPKVRSVLNVSNSTFNNNTVNKYSGGAIQAYDYTNITGSTFTNNRAGIDGAFTEDNGGGAITLGAFGTVKIDNSTFSGNSAYDGGAIGTNKKANYTSGSLVVTNSVFSENSANRGGAILNWYKNNINGEAENLISNSTFEDNTASISGGAIFNAGDLKFSGNNVFAENIGGGVLNDIHNTGAIDVSGHLTLDGGISGDGTLNLASGTNLTVNSATTISNAIANAGATLNIVFNNGFFGDEYTLLSGTGSLDNEFTLASNALYDVTESSTKGTYTVAQKSSEDVAEATGANSNQMSVIEAIIGGEPTGRTNFDDVTNDITTLLQSADPSQVQAGVNAVTA